MKISYKWLSEILNGLDKVSAEDLAHKLTMSGLEIEEILDQKAKYKNIVVGEVLKKEPHPDADKLNVCEVSDGTEVFQVVCGAKNVAAGSKFPFARLGTVMPNGLEIKPIKLRGVQSSGMLCSASELELSEESEGLLVLDLKLKTGTEISEALGLDDVLLEVNVTPNRGDALSHWGIAKDVAALTGLKPDFEKIYPKGVGQNFETSDSKNDPLNIQVSVEDQQGCARYSASSVTGVKVGPSPAWLQTRLQAVGLRSINNVVDATNYTMMLTGHPVHAFDARQIQDNHLRVYALNRDEKFKTLDEIERELKVGDLVIADAKNPVALAGIMGGMNSSVQDDTKDLILEVAFFDPNLIRKTSRRLGLQTDSSYRFSRFVNPDSVLLAHQILQDLIVKLAGGEKGKIHDVYPEPFQSQVITLTESELVRILGIEIPREQVQKSLESLSFQVKPIDEGFEVTVPIGRSDVTRPIDLIEEVARIYGLNKIPEEMPRLLLRVPTESPVYQCDREVKEFFLARGFTETIHLSFSDEKSFQKVLADNDANWVKLQNPISEDLSVMRPSLLPHLLACYKKNHLNSETGLKFFELRKVYSKGRETYQFMALFGGNPHGRNRFGLKRELDVFYAKGLLETLMKQANVRLQFDIFEESPFHPGQAFVYRDQNQNVMKAGAVHPQILQKLKIKEKLFAIEIDFDWLTQNYKTSFSKFKSLSSFPPVYRDLAIVADQKLSYGDIVSEIAKQKPVELKDVHLFDLFEGESIGAGKKSYTFSMVYESKDENLTDEKVNELHFGLVDKLKTKLNISLR